MNPQYAATFKDKRGRTIGIALEQDILAYHEEHEVGRFQMAQFEDESGVYDYIEYLDIVDGYRRAGIGINMLRVASEFWGTLSIGNWSPFGDNPLLPDGRALMMRAVELGYVHPENIDHWVLPDN